MDSLYSRIHPRHWAYLALAAWGVLTLLLLRQDMYVLNEGAAKSLLLSWSIADQVASSVITFGTPDLRALLFLPIGFLWTGSIFAAKVLTVGLLAIAIWLFYSWKQRSTDAECALLASGLLIISPLALAQIDSLSPGIYLLTAFALGAWLDMTYRANPKFFGGWYFAQLFLCAFSVSLHPAGLAYPLSLLWSWRTEPLDRKHQKYFLVGVSLATLLILVIRMGWNDLIWLQNPITQLSAILISASSDNNSAMQWIVGGIVVSMLIFIIAKQHRNLWPDFTGRTLLIALLLGAFVGDEAWSLIALSIILYFGIPLLLRSAKASTDSSFLKQRGLALLLVFLASTFFMIADRTHYEIKLSNELPPQDQLIKALAEEAQNALKDSEADEAANKRSRIVVASQWPSRTMIACKCDTLPLPPPASDPPTQLAQLRGGTHITHLLLDPKQTSNVALARNLSLLGGAIETSALLQPGGVLLHVKEDGDATQNLKNH